jgi:hypothetical protein
MTVSLKVVYGSAAALLLVLAATIPAVRWFESQVGDTGVHGPVAVVIALPLVVIYAAGALTLARAALRARIATIPMLVAQLPAGVFAIGTLVLLVLAGSPRDPIAANNSSQPSVVGRASTICGGGSLYRTGAGSRVVPPRLLMRVFPRRPDFPVPDPYGVGMVMVEAVVTKNGKICSPRIWRGTGTAFDDESLAATKLWHFSPGTLDSRPVNCLVVLTIPLPRGGPN